MLYEFGNRIKEIRENLGLSQLILSEKTGIVREQISRIENGQINPTLETVAKLSLALEISLSDLFNFQIIEEYKYKKYQFKPFVKWAGGKTQLLVKIKKYLPNKFDTYYEPFIGGGALFFNLVPKRAVIADYNGELISAYKCFQDSNMYKLMILELIKHQKNHSEDYYYQVRNADRIEGFQDLPEFIKAARMIYLNKACFNGLYRVNSKGYFNVPSGKKTVVNAYNKTLFDNLHEYLKNEKITILQNDFAKVVENAKKGDFVYFDPPYDTLEYQNNFTTYTKDNFGKNEQKRLSDVFKKLDEKGVQVMLSNHNTTFIRELYKKYKINIVKARRSINSKGTGRGSVEEVIITNY